MYKRFLGFLLKKLGLACIHADCSIFISKTSRNKQIVSIFATDIKFKTSKKQNYQTYKDGVDNNLFNS